MPTSEPALGAGAVVIIPFPYADRLAEKRRPAVVISNASVAAAGFVWIAMITSARNAPMADDLPIADLARAGLAKPSVVRPLKIACIDGSRVVRRAGDLDPAAAEHLFDRVRSLIGRA
ncbi:hypothetical protein BHAOGJBA_3862 [Methylobacterium hispanicum]|jgi:mRNA interferase MazF|uniref:Type II toxin-antitoxin system PemK/MazF family toxin n=1 Tax=Methylobacterium hispanicum TaxID=270350 RepID=A0AAV4ZQ91_9HYPH|nr:MULTISPECIES: type II toxin-antitoxin system PemK/MazF family toxin [Methylobacterium]GJD90324.1 hypothetical protein BHAOGJBA_3862 [Methylobacterium hispanicum]